MVFYYLLGVYLNTSNVTVNQVVLVLYHGEFTDLNTSNVTVNLIHVKLLLLYKMNLNTSNVTVNPPANVIPCIKS